MKKYTTLLAFLWVTVSPTLGAQNHTAPQQWGKVKIESTPYSTTITDGTNTYTVTASSFGGIKVEGDVKFPKKNTPVHAKIFEKNGFEPKSNVNSKGIGLRADLIQFLPNVGLVGIKYTMSQTDVDKFKKKELQIAQGEVSWRLNTTSGEVALFPDDEVLIREPYQHILAKQLLYVGRNQTPEKKGTMSGYLYEDAKLKEQWDKLSIMGSPRTDWRKQIDIKRYYRYGNGYIQLAIQKEGKTHEVVVLDAQLKRIKTYYPALIVYRNYNLMPSHNGESGLKLVKDYRTGNFRSPDKVFHRQVLVPSESIEGLYGVLQADGTIEIPQGSLGLTPILTEEKEANSKTNATYLLNHFFMVAFPGGSDGKMNYAVADPEGKLSFGSYEKPVWKDFFVHLSDAIEENNDNIYVHRELIVAQLADGKWQCYLASRYHLSKFQRYETLGYYFPTPIGQSALSQVEAIISAEQGLIALDTRVGIYNEKVRKEHEERMKRDWDKMQAALAIKRREEAERWAASRPQPQASSQGSNLFKSDWQGFSYTPETTRRYNQSVNQSNYNNAMKQYNSYLNSKIYGTRY